MNPPPDGDGHSRIGDFTERIRTGARRAFSASEPYTAITEAIVMPPVTRKHLPLRYHIKEDDKGRFLSCTEASNIAVRVERGLSISAAAARKYPRGTVFLDGVAQGEPFIDSAKGVYNLDHHEGCVRSFTLATCEQAIIVILKGLDLEDERWVVYANDPDFDTVLAIWLLLNHRRLSEEGSQLRTRLMPMIRLQGVIDAHGLERMDLTAFPAELQKTTFDAIAALRTDELAIKGKGEWEETDLLEFTRSVLQQIDDMVYVPSDFEGQREVDELARIKISPQRFAVACRSEAGIYEVEEHLKEVHGDRLGLVILQKNANTYTLRQTDPFLPTTLDGLYERLNLLDPAAVGNNRWGGSAEIGGSPRASGSALDLEAIIGICRWVFNPPGPGKQLAAIGSSVSIVAVAFLIAIISSGGSLSFRNIPGLMEQRGGASYLISALVLVTLGLGLTYLSRLRSPGHFGLRRPTGWLFLAAVPFGVIAAMGGGAWWPNKQLATGDWLWWLGLAGGVAGMELLVRGRLHGGLVKAFPVMLPGGRHFLSVPNGVAAVFSTGATMACFGPPSLAIPGLTGASLVALWALACLLMGLLSGGVRERWGSVWAAVVVHYCSALGAYLVLEVLL